MKKIAGLILIMVSAHSFSLGQEEEYVYQQHMKEAAPPVIEVDYKIVLSGSMAEVLKKRVPEFKIWTREHFHPYTIVSYRFDTPYYAHALRTYQSPSGVIGDFNGDNRLDIALTGYNKTHELFVILLSKQEDYGIIVSTKAELPQKFDPYQASMTVESIELAHKHQKFKNECTGEVLDLKTDAVKIVEEWKPDKILYYEAGRFKTFVCCNKNE